MSWATSEIVAVLTFLLPGFVGAAVFYALTSHPRPSEFGQVVQALVFTTVGQAVAWLVRLLASLWWEYQWPAGLELTVAVASAVGVALLAAGAANHDVLHRPLRWLRVTRETSYPSEWYSAFAENPNCYVVLYLTGERRLRGWPEEVPTHPERGHVIISECEWLTDKGPVALEKDSILVIDGKEVEMVQFLGVPTESARRE